MRARAVLATLLAGLGGWCGPCVRSPGAVCTVVRGTGRPSAGLACREWCYDRGRFAVGERGMLRRTVLAAPLTALGGWSGLCVRLAGAVCTVLPLTGRFSAGSACGQRCCDREDLGRFAVGERGMRARTVLAAPLAGLGGWSGLAGAVCTVAPAGLACRERRFDRVPWSAA